MGKLGIALLVGLLVVGLHVSSSADQERQVVELFTSGNRDCSKGTIEQRLDCMNFEILQLKKQLEGQEGRIVPLR